MSTMGQFNKVLIRKGSLSDAPEILNLFNREYPEYVRDHPYWIWINKIIGDRESLITVAEIDNKIIGHYCIIPRTLIINHVKYNVGMGIQAIIDRQYQKKVSIFDISSHTHKMAVQSGMVMLYGFPNQNYHLIQEKIERWDVVSRFYSIDFDLAGVKNTTNLELVLVNNIDKDQFKERMLMVTPKSYGVCLNNTLSYYYDRYITHPHSIYSSYFIYKNSKLEGVVTLKVFKKQIVHIIDFYIDRDVEEADLIKSSLSQFSLKKGSLWKTNVDFEKGLRSVVQRTMPGFKTNLLVKFLDLEFKNKNKLDILDINNWNLPMGTSDAF